MPQRAENYTKNKGGGVGPVARLAHCIRVDFTCPYCGADLRTVKTISMDHVKPQVYGGTTSERNVIACCQPCNSSKQAKSLAAFAASRKNPNLQLTVRKCLKRKLPIEHARKLMGNE